MMGAIIMADSKGIIINADEKGSINISEDVVVIIAATAAAETEGVHGLFASHNKEITNMLVKKGLSKGVKLYIEGDDITIDINVIAEMGFSVNEIGAKVQKAVISAVEDTMGVTVKAVNVSICGIALKKKER